MPVNQDQPSFTPYKLGRMRDILSELRKKHGDDIVVYNQKKDLRDEIASSIDEITPANAYWYIDSLLKLGAATHDKSSILVDTTYAISVPEENENTVTESAVTDKTMTEQATSFEHIDTLLPDNELPADEAIERLLALLLSARRELLHRDETINQLYTQLNDTNSKLEQVNAQAESSRMSADSLRQDNVKLRQRVSELEQTLTEAEQLATALEQQLTYATTKKVNLRQLYAKVSDKS